MADTTSPTASDRTPTGDDPAEIPQWDDAYLTTLSERLHQNYDLVKDRSVHDQQFALYGHMELHNQRYVLHPALSVGHYEIHEHLFVRRVEAVSERDIQHLVEFGHELAEDATWIDPDEEHYATEFTFVLIAPSIPEAVRSRVSGIDERSLLKYGYNGHYEINVAVVAPTAEQIVSNDAADIAPALRTWDPTDTGPSGVLGRLRQWLR